MKRIPLLFSALVALLVGCGRLLEPSTPPREHYVYPKIPPTFGTRDSVFSDSQLIAAAYTSYYVPPGFYHEDPPVPYYVNTVSVKPVCCRPNEWRELATEDTTLARAWVDSTVADAHLDIGPARVTARYIEFRSTLGAAYRVHRSSYLDPVAFVPTFWSSDSLIGTFGVRPVDPAGIRTLAEYLWFKWNRELYGQKVLSSIEGSSSGDAVVHTLYECVLILGDFGMHDQIRLYRSEFRVSTTSGEIILRRILQRTVEGAPR